MATRPVYIPCNDSDLFVRTVMVDFKWHPGMAASQKKKSVNELHASAKELGLCSSPLEVSSKSDLSLGVQLSAFNLEFRSSTSKKCFTVESAFQSSKVFENGGPYIDLLNASSIEAKRDDRLKKSGDLVRFDFFGTSWPLEPKTLFYDWIYMQALKQNKQLISEALKHDAFTDIEFNPKKSMNCQAYSVALFVSLLWRGVVNAALSSEENYIDIISKAPVSSTNEDSYTQPKLL